MLHPPSTLPSTPREPGATLRVVVADDERPARLFLLGLLRGTPDVEVVGEAADGAEAVALIERTRPDLALLDLQMPEVDGLGVVRLLRRDALPLVAFVTAYDQYAVQAFELNAVDYLLKPVDAPRLRHTLTRAHDRLERADWRARAHGVHAERPAGRTSRSTGTLTTGRPARATARTTLGARPASTSVTTAVRTARSNATNAPASGGSPVSRAATRRCTTPVARRTGDS